MRLFTAYRIYFIPDYSFGKTVPFNMSTHTLHPKISARKQTAGAINYNAVSVNQFGELEKRGILQNRANKLDERVVEGYGVIWGTRNSYGEKFIKGSFSKSIQERGPASTGAYQIKFLYQHYQTDPLSLFDVLEEDEIGLYFRTKPLDDVNQADRVLKQLRSGTLNNFSIGWNFVWDKIEWDDDDDSLIIKEAALYEISVVSIPSDMTTFAIRSKEDIEDLYDETEDFIKRLPRKEQLEARTLFARHKSLANFEPPAEVRKALESNKPVANGIDYNKLLKKL